MMSRKLICIFLFQMILGTGTQAWSQGREYIYDHFNIYDGLISDNVSKIFLDTDGNAWIITYNGLQKYNGYDYTTYTSDAGTPGSLTSNFVENIFEDAEGDILVVFENGIDIYDKKTDSFRNIVWDLEYAALRRDEISRQASAVQDKTGCIWINCNNQLVRIDSAKTDFITYDREYRGRFVLNRDSSALLIITDQTLKRYDLVHKLLTITNINDIPSPLKIRQLNTIYRDSRNVCWLGTSEGLFIFDEDQYIFVDPFSGYSQQSEDQGDSFKGGVTAIYEDFQQDIWVASGSTLWRINRQTGNVEILRHDPYNPGSILDAQITGIHGNHSGMLWLTYLNEGFTRIHIRGQNFRSYRFRGSEGNGLGGNTVRSIFEDRAGYIWVGLYNEGLDRIDQLSDQITHYKHDPSNAASICSNYISSLFLDHRERLWVGSHDYGLCFADNAHSESLKFRKGDFLNQNEEIYHILGDSLNRIWIGTRNGLALFDYRSGSFQWILENHNVQSFLFDKQSVWIASWNHGLCRLDFDPESFASLNPEFNRTTSIFFDPDENKEGGDSNGKKSPVSIQNCISIYQDDSSHIWIGTFGMGLAKAETKGRGVDYALYDVSHGAPGNSIYGIAGDQQGNIWISTENGLGKFNPETERFINYYREDGLLSDFFMWKSYFKAPDGELYFGSVDGLNVFNPRDIHTDTSSPRVFISEFRIQNRLVECGDTINGEVILDRHIAYMDHLVLNHRNNRNFSFSYYATGLVNYHSIRYWYMLEGFDMEWIEDTKGNRLATYSNLSPGTYYFRVRASDNELTWDGSFEEKVLTILPPWWKTNIAYMVYLLLVLILVFVITHSLIRFIGLKHELNYNEKLHQSKLTFFTNISHEFKTPLSLIKAPLNDILSDKGLSPRNRKNLIVARQNADNLLKLVNELLEFRRTDVGISKLRAERIELNSFLKQIVDEFECIAEQKQVDFYFDIPENRVPLWVDREKFRKIINNLLENALNYTREKGLVTLSIIDAPLLHKFKANHHTLQLNNVQHHLDYIGILVSDTGMGISGESLPRIFDRFYQIEAERASHHIGSGIGLALVKNLVLMHHGEIRVGSDRGVGTDILVMFPLGDKHLSVEDKSMMQLESQKGHPVYEVEPVSASVKEAHMNFPDKKSTIPLILIVEDHEELRGYLKERFLDDYRVMDASNGATAIELMKQARPDLLITDWIMPVMDGEALITYLRADDYLSSVPVILLTAKSEMHDHQLGLNMGADLVISKPFSIQLLMSQVRRIIESKRSLLRNYVSYGVDLSNELKATKDSEFIKLLEKTVLEHIRERSLNAATLAEAMGMSRTVLYEKLKSVTGESIGELIHRVRLKQAIRLMLYENRPLSEIHVMVGFSSTSYFIRVFRKYYHVTPGEYIRNFLNISSN